MLILASASPRRQELLKQIVSEFRVEPSGIEEKIPYQSPLDCVLQLAKRKAEDVASRHSADTIVGADTVVVYRSQIFGKPVNEAKAVEMLSFLSGKVHEVITAVCVINKGKAHADFERSLVTFRTLSQEQIEDYIAKFQPLDKAGSYGIQDNAGLIESYTGSYENIMGLPLEVTRLLLDQIS